MSAVESDWSLLTTPAHGVLVHAERLDLNRPALLRTECPTTVSPSSWQNQSSFCTKDTVHTIQKLKRALNNHETEFRRIAGSLQELCREEHAYQELVKINVRLRNTATEHEFEARRRHLSIARKKVHRLLEIDRSGLAEEEQKQLRGRELDIASHRDLAPAIFRQKKCGTSASPERAATGDCSVALPRCG